MALGPDLPTLLAERLKRPLPGRAAQSRFEPELSYGRHFGPPSRQSRSAAVLLLLYWADGEWRMPLTVRPAAMQLHAGQISLPGGVVEPGETSEQAALRELDEELGVAAGQTRILGRLSPLNLFVTDFWVLPWVAVAHAAPVWRPNACEVAKVLEIPLAHLLDARHFGRHHRRNRGVGLWAPHIFWQGYRIWGATSMMLGELAALLSELDDL